MEIISLTRRISDKRKEIYTYLHTVCPSRVQNGSIQLAAEFKDWCNEAQLMLKKQLVVNDATLMNLENLASRYNQFTNSGLDTLDR